MCWIRPRDPLVQFPFRQSTTLEASARVLKGLFQACEGELPYLYVT